MSASTSASKHTLDDDTLTRPTKRLRDLQSRPSTSMQISELLRLTEDEVGSLRKSELVQYFLALQSHARNPQPIHDAPPPPEPLPCREQVDNVDKVDKLPPFLAIPVEIRLQIYSYLLSPPLIEAFIPGPHPRQLQGPLGLAQSFPPAILRANKQVYHEALTVFYGSQSQTVRANIDYYVWMHKTQRSDLVFSPSLPAAIRNVRVNVFLGKEKKNNKPLRDDSDARLAVICKGVRKLGKWLAVADIKSLEICWHEPPQTFTWEHKMQILDEFRAMKADKVKTGCINWGLKYPGKQYRFDQRYLKTLESGYVGDAAVNESNTPGESSESPVKSKG